MTRRAILLAEDDPDIAEMIAECLQGEGYAVTVAPHVAAGLVALADGNFALVLTDAFANHEVAGGQWVAVEEVRRAAGATPVIICTAHRSQEFRDFAERGFAAVLTKPFDLDDLLALIARLIAAAAAPRRDKGGARQPAAPCQRPTRG